MIKVGIIGAAGYSGGELVRLLLNHPTAKIKAVTSRSLAGKAFSETFPHFRGLIDLDFVSPDDPSIFECNVIFFATPHGTAMIEARRLLEKGIKVIDLSADFRIKDPALFEKWYKISHISVDLLEKAVYGLPEINRQKIASASLVANPGCYPTAIQLGFYPLLKTKSINSSFLIADAMSGTSGAGKKAAENLLFSEVTDSLRAYSITGHRHLPEITGHLSSTTDQKIGLTFTPHLAPMIRGIHATLHAKLLKDIDIQDLFETNYQDETFVDVLPSGMPPETRSVRGTNMCRISVLKTDQHVTILSVIDNLVKGASGQAIQNMNLMFGEHEWAGLPCIPTSP